MTDMAHYKFPLLLLFLLFLLFLLLLLLLCSIGNIIIGEHVIEQSQ